MVANTIRNDRKNNTCVVRKSNRSILKHHLHGSHHAGHNFKFMGTNCLGYGCKGEASILFRGDDLENSFIIINDFWSGTRFFLIS